MGSQVIDRLDWWTKSSSVPGRAQNLLRRIGKYKEWVKPLSVPKVGTRAELSMTIGIAGWVLDLVTCRSAACRKGRANRVVTLKAAKRLAASAELRAAFDSVYRISGTKAASAWVVALIVEPEPKKTPEEIKAARSVGVKRRVEQREAHARRMLRDHERAFRREEKLVARWARVVRRYDRRNEG